MPNRGVVRLLLVVPFLFMLLLGGTEAGRLITPIRALGALAGAGVVGWYVVHLPRQHDLVDRLALASLIVFVIACVASPGSRSFDAATTALACTAVFYLARGVVEGEAGRRWAMAVLGAAGLVVATIFLVQWAGVWLEWIGVPGAGLPPLELLLPTAQYGHHYRVAFLIGMLLPAVATLGAGTRFWPVGVFGLCAGTAVIAMSGSRTAWLAGAVSIVIAVLGTRRARPLNARWVLPAAAIVIFGGAALAIATPLVDRLLTTSTLELRVAVWEAALGEWLQTPVAGSGPGSFHTQLMLSGYYNAYEPYIPHAHNALVQTIVETGILGVAALALATSALVVGFVRAGAVHWAPAAGIAFFAAVSLGETPVAYTYLVLPLIVWAALATPRTGEARTSHNPAFRAAAVGLTVFIAAGVILFFVGAATYDRARVAATVNDDEQALEALELATRLDPSSALYWRDLGVRLLAGSRYAEARAALTRAAQLNPGDQAVQHARAVLGVRSEDIATATDAAENVVRVASMHVNNHLTQAYVSFEFGDPATGRDALVAAVRLQPWLLAAPEWQTVFPEVGKQELLSAAERSWAGDPARSSRNTRARTWLAAMTGRPLPEDAGGYLLAEAALLECDRETAAQVLSGLKSGEAAQPAALQARVMTARAFGVGGQLSVLRELIHLSDRQLERMAFDGIAGSSIIADSNRTRGAYGTLPLVTDLDPILPTPASGLSAWLRDPASAADLGAPGSGLAQCR